MKKKLKSNDGFGTRPESDLRWRHYRFLELNRRFRKTIWINSRCDGSTPSNVGFKVTEDFFTIQTIMNFRRYWKTVKTVAPKINR